MIVNTTGIPPATLYGIALRFQARRDVLSQMNSEIDTANESRPNDQQEPLATLPTWQEFLDGEFLARAEEANRVLQHEANNQLALFVNALPEQTVNALKQQFNVPNLIRDEVLALLTGE
jgi:hypothetical protein